MKQKLTIFFSACVCLSMCNVYSQNGGMYIRGDVINSGKVRVEGPVSVAVAGTVSAGRVNNGGTIVLCNGIEYQTNDHEDGILWNDPLKSGKLLYPTVESQKSVQVRKTEMQTNKWYYVSFPFRVKVGDVLTANPGIEKVFFRYYDSQKRANTNKVEDNWSDYLTADDYLDPMIGYAFAYSKQSSLREVIFPISEDCHPDTIHRNVKSKAITYWAPAVPYAIQTDSSKGWNCLGSPYTSRYIISATSTELPLGYIYHSKTMGGYAIYDLSDDDPAFSLTIRPYSLTFYKLKDDAVSYVTFGQTYSSLSGNGNLVRSSAADTGTQKVAVRLSNENDEYDFDYCRLYLSDSYQDSYSQDDAIKMLGTDDVSEIWFRAKNTNLSIATLPEESISPEGLPLVVKFGKPGNYTLSFMGRYPDIAFLELYDKKLDIRTNLLTDSCSLVIEQAAVCHDRFYLLPGSRISTGIDGNVEAGKALDIYASNGLVYVKGLSVGDRVYVYDSVGKLLGSANAGGEEVVVPVSANGLCIVKVTGSVQEVRKVFSY